MSWNEYINPISTRLRDEDALLDIVEGKHLIYHPSSGETAIVLDVFVVDLDDDVQNTTDIFNVNNGFVDHLEDRYIHWMHDEHLYEDFSITLDDEGWVWADEHPLFLQSGTVDGEPGEAQATVYLSSEGGSLERKPEQGISQ